MDLAFASEVDRPVSPPSVVYSDNVVGGPASLSDSRLKRAQQPVPTATLTSIPDGIETKEYDLQLLGIDIDGAPLPAEKRVGFIADEVKSALAGLGWSNVVGTKPLGDEVYLTLDYSRCFCLLWGVVKDLTARVTALEG